MKYLIKINKLYLYDFEINMLDKNNEIQSISLDYQKYYECESYQEAEVLKFIINVGLGIPKDNVTIQAINKED